MNNRASKLIGIGARHLAVCAGFLSGAIFGSPSAPPDPAPASAGAALLADSLRPRQADVIALAPDGRHLAYSSHEDNKALVIIMDLDKPGKRVAAVVGHDWGSGAEKILGRVDQLQWADGTRLVVNSGGIISAVDADGRNGKTLVDDPEFGAPRLMPEIEGAAGRAWVEGFVRNEIEPQAVLCEVDARSGARLSTVKADVGMLPGDCVFDRQGRLRLQRRLKDPMAASAGILYRGPDGSGRWADFDAWIGEGSPGFRVTQENYSGRRSVPLGFDEDPEILYFASNAVRDTFGIYALDLRKKKMTGFKVEGPEADVCLPTFGKSPLVFDQSRKKLVGIRVRTLELGTRWIDPELGRVQELLAGQFTNRQVSIEGWDDSRERYLVKVSGRTDPGRYFVYFSKGDRLLECVRCAPWLEGREVSRKEPFAFVGANGVRLTGWLTIPRAPKVVPPPLLVELKDGPAGLGVGTTPLNADMMADMGFVVIQVNYRGTAGFGLNHQNAARDGVDRIPVEDVLSTIEWATSHHWIDPKRVALLGTGFGGFVALRALEMHPDRFRAVIAVNPPADLSVWLSQDDKGGQKTDLRSAAGNFDKMVLTPDMSSGVGLEELQGNQDARGSDHADKLELEARDSVVSSAMLMLPERQQFFGFRGRGDIKRFKSISPLQNAGSVTKPVMLIGRPTFFLGSSTEMTRGLIDLRGILVRRGMEVDYLLSRDDGATPVLAALRDALTRRELAAAYVLDMPPAAFDSSNSLVALRGRLLRRGIAIEGLFGVPDAQPDSIGGLASALERRHADVEYLELPFEFGRSPPVTARMCSKIESFLNASVYDYGVQIGRPKVLKMPADEAAPKGDNRP